MIGNTIVKISERKHRLRARGIVPVAQAPVSERGEQARQGPRREKGAASARQKNGTTRPAPRTRWQPSPTYQIAFGVAYVVFAPFLFINNLALMHAPRARYHPGAFEFIMPVVFFLFGLWWLYRGVQARRKTQAQPVGEVVATRPRFFKRAPR